MTTEFKMPEPVQNHSDVQMYGYEAIIPIAASTNLYTASDMRAVIDHCAHISGCIPMDAYREIRKLLEQVK